MQNPNAIIMCVQGIVELSGRSSVVIATYVCV